MVCSWKCIFNKPAPKKRRGRPPKKKPLTIKWAWDILKQTPSFWLLIILFEVAVLVRLLGY